MDSLDEFEELAGAPVGLLISHDQGLPLPSPPQVPQHDTKTNVKRKEMSQESYSSKDPRMVCSMCLAGTGAKTPRDPPPRASTRLLNRVDRITFEPCLSSLHFWDRIDDDDHVSSKDDVDDDRNVVS